MDGFEKRKEKKMKQIFSASLDLVCQYGFDKISVNEIAAKARVSPATIYNYFGTKEQLYHSMLHDWVDSKIHEYDVILQSGKSFNDKIKDIMTLEAHNLRLLANMSQSQSQDPEPVHFFLSGVEEKLESFFHRLVHIGKTEGYIAKGFSDKVLLKHFKLFFYEISEHISVHGKRENDEEMDQLLQLFFYGLTPNQVIK
ncbi:TetR/AcrR family transcriptional regulator [Alkalihalophilus pseudofirmus]|uniref:TetR/AcrR family transcriptional regulator n=1 Tax=Alkalihalophilus pseudofirmus TaxID=79885 RepID=UPI00259BAAD5|nr:TetR/AcrR family transcriptional regulator [Alkalihalophilus pseudofirmus]WEG15083.1 TetR/AcrR family transcriptional regulator [Alkalihalophilus pseudofirmus]